MINTKKDLPKLMMPFTRKNTGINAIFSTENLVVSTILLERETNNLQRKSLNQNNIKLIKYAKRILLILASVREKYFLWRFFINL